MKRMMSTVLAIILVITSLMGTTMIAQAANYSAFPVCQEEKEDALQTAPELKLNQSYRVSFKNGVYTNPERMEVMNTISIPQKRRPLRLPPIMCTEIRPVARHIFKRARPTILWPMQPMMITMWKRP